MSTIRILVGVLDSRSAESYALRSCRSSVFLGGLIFYAATILATTTTFSAGTATYASAPVIATAVAAAASFTAALTTAATSYFASAPAATAASAAPSAPASTSITTTATSFACNASG